MCGLGARPTLLLKLYEGGGDNAGNRVRAREGDERAGYFAHDADGAAAVDEVDVVLVEGFPEGFCGGEMGW